MKEPDAFEPSKNYPSSHLEDRPQNWLSSSLFQKLRRILWISLHLRQPESQPHPSRLLTAFQSGVFLEDTEWVDGGDLRNWRLTSVFSSIGSWFSYLGTCEMKSCRCSSHFLLTGLGEGWFFETSGQNYTAKLSPKRWEEITKKILRRKTLGIAARNVHRTPCQEAPVSSAIADFYTSDHLCVYETS